jgi:DNA polymerase III delta prime subunit
MSEKLWVEKYRPATIDEVILPQGLTDVFTSMVKTGKVPNMLFTGSAGVGKTTVAKALCNQLNLDYLMVNGSEDGNIDTLRGKIKHFASTVSLQGGLKVVILDEADYLNPQSTQPALRGFMEEFSGNCRFILTCNFKNRIIDPLHSRCSVYDFSIPKDEKPQLATALFKRVTNILTEEDIKFSPDAVANLTKKYFPDFRRIINELQRYSSSGEIDSGILVNLGEENFKQLIDHLKTKQFSKMRGWVANNSDIDSSVIFRKVYDSATEYLDSSSVPAIILILGEYQFKAAFVADRELNIVACLTEIMGTASWK